MLRFKHLFIFFTICMTLMSTVMAEEDAADQTQNVEQIKEFIDTGRRYYRQRLYEKAIEAWQQALDLDPENSKIEKYIERAQAKLGITPAQTTPDTAEEQAETTETAGTSQVDQLIDQGRNFYREGKYEQALGVWEQAATLEPDNKRLKRYMVKAQEKVATEIPPEQPVTQEPPTTTEAQQTAFEELVSQGKEHFRKNEFEQAVTVWEQALEIDPNNEKIQKYIEKAQAKITPEQPVQPQDTTPQPSESQITETPSTPRDTMDSDIAQAEEIEIPVIIEEDNDIIRRDLEWCVNIAIENHREALIAREKIKKAEIDLFIARRNFFPNLSFEYSTAQGGSGGLPSDNDSAPPPEGTRDFVRNRYKFQLSHMIYTGGQARSEVEKAHISLEIEQKDYRRVVGQKALEVAKAYYEVARTEANLKIQGALLRKAADSLKLVQEQFNAGLVAELELLNMKALLNQIHSQVAAAQQELSQAVLDLQQVMNIDITTPIRVYPLEESEISLDGRYVDIPLLQNIQTFSPTQQAVDDKNQMRMDSYVIHAMKNRPDFSAEQLKFKRSEKDLEIAKKAFAPKVEFFGELGEGLEDDVQRVRDLKALQREWMIGMNVSWNLWGSTINYRQEEKAESPSVTSVGTEAQREYTVRAGILDNLQPLSDQQEMVVKRLEALNDLGNLKNTITEEVRDAFHNFLKAKISKDTAKSKIDFRKKTVDLYKLQRSLGELETSKLVQAEIDLSNEQQELHRSLADFMIQLASLDSALGKSLFFAAREDQEQEIAEADIPPADNDTADNESLMVHEPVVEETVEVEYTGFLFKLDQITVGPSTHKIVNGFKNRRWVALARSDSINLNDYLGKKVLVSGQSLKTEDWIDTVIIDNIQVVEKKWFWNK